MWAPQGAPRPGARRGPKRVSTQRGRPGARVVRAPAPPRGPPNGGENVSKTPGPAARAVRRPGARMRLVDGRGWRPPMIAGELEVPRRRREELAAGRGKDPQPEPSGGPRYGATGVAARGATVVAAARARTRSAARALKRPSCRVAQGPRRALARRGSEPRAGQGPQRGPRRGRSTRPRGQPQRRARAGPRAGRGPEGLSQRGSRAEGPHVDGMVS